MPHMPVKTSDSIKEMLLFRAFISILSLLGFGMLAFLVYKDNDQALAHAQGALQTFVSGCSGTTTEEDNQDSLTVKHILFGIGSSPGSWPKRRALVRQWWTPELRGHVWVEGAVEVRPSPGDPEIRQSSDTRHLAYTGAGSRSSLHIARIVVDAFRLQLPDVRWYVTGDDDTFFSPGGLTAVLSKYNPAQKVYVGGRSETHGQMVRNSFEMAYGGGGVAVSAALAAALNATLDACIDRHPGLWGSDERLAKCAAELGVRLTVERGFHQCDVKGSLEGLLEAHPTQPLVSLHHLLDVAPVFPDMPAERRLAALARMAAAIAPDPVGFAQHAVCYDRTGKAWTASISWGYSVKLLSGIVLLGDLERVPMTFSNFFWQPNRYDMAMDTQPPEVRAPSKSECGLPSVMYASRVQRLPDGAVASVYNQSSSTSRSKCEAGVRRVASVVVIREQPLAYPRGKGGRYLGPNLEKQCCKEAGMRGAEAVFRLGTCGASESISA
eukprot:jgi/Mesen1/10809/ME000093S10328